MNNWSSGGAQVTHLGKMPEQLFKVGLEHESKPMHFHRESRGPQELGVGVGVGEAGEQKLLVYRWSSPVRQWWLEDGAPRPGAPVTQL